MITWWLAATNNQGDSEIDVQLDGELLGLRQAVEASGEAIILTDREGIITYVNPQFTQTYGFRFDEVVGKTTPRILKSGLMTAEEYAQFWQTLLSRQIRKGEMINRCKDGRLITVESSANAIVNPSNQIIGFLAIQRDITARKEAEKKLKRRNRRLAILNSIASTVNQSLDLRQIMENALSEVLLLDIFGKDAKGMVFLLDESGQRLTIVSYKGAPENHPCLHEPVAVGECLCGIAAQEGRLIVSDDKVKDERHTRCPIVASHIDVCLPLKAHGRVLGVMNVRLPANFQIGDGDRELLTSVADQIAMAVENATLFEAVSDQRRRLKALAARSVDLEESERRRLSRELHDQIGQNLSAVGLNLTIIGAMMDDGKLQEGFKRLDDTRKLIEHMTDQIRNLMVELRPPILDDYGLPTALEWYAGQTQDRTGLHVKVDCPDHALRLRPEVEIALFRIAQEALSNVVKHAKAREVTITLDNRAGTVRLHIQDDGCGLDATGHEHEIGESGWGCLIMAERAEALGGFCQIQTDPIQGGTIVIAEVPQ